MTLRSKNKEKFQQELEQTRTENDELMRLKMGKKKIDLNGRYQKKDFHNILNSLLGEVIEEDLFNQFWNHYFRNSAHLKDILHAYNTALLMLIENIARNNNRIADLQKDKQRLKQNHDFKNVNMVNVDLETLDSENAQYREDLRELSKPFQFNFAPLIENLHAILAKISKTMEQNRPPENVELDGDILRDVLAFSAPDAEEQVSEDLQLNNEQKYHRFALYLGCIALVIDLSMIYNKYNFLDIIIGTIFVGNSLLQDYCLKWDFVNRVLQKVQVNCVEDRLVIRDAFSAEDVKKVVQVVEERHNFDNYAHSSFLMLSVVLLWDLLWIIFMHGPYDNCQGKGFTIESASCSAFWRYNRYIFYASIYTAVSKAIILISMFQMSSLSFGRIFSRHNLVIFLFRFSDLIQNINQLVQNNK